MYRFLALLVVSGGCDGLLGDDADKDTTSGETGSVGDDDDVSGDDDDTSGGDDDDDTAGDDDDDHTGTYDDGLDCDADYPTPAPGGIAACITEELSCGDVIFGTLDGGSTNYDYDFWELQQELDALFGEYEALDGEERVYLFSDPTVSRARITVHTCFDQWDSWIIRGQYCSTSEETTAGVFEGGETDDHTWYTDIINDDGTFDYEFVIEGLYGATGNYVISIECY